MHARNATVKKVDKTLKALSSATLSVTPTQSHLMHETVPPAAGIRDEDSGDDSDGWETDLECDEVTVHRSVCSSRKYPNLPHSLFWFKPPLPTPLEIQVWL